MVRQMYTVEGKIQLPSILNQQNETEITNAIWIKYFAFSSELPDWIFRRMVLQHW